MRSCIYCGRELAEGEKCSCPGAAARRAAKDGGSASQNTDTSTQYNNSGTNTQYTRNENGYYRTGYTQAENPLKRKWNRYKAKRQAAKSQRTPEMRGIFSYIYRFIKSPATEIANPRAFSMPQMLLIAAIQGAVIGLCVYFVNTGAPRGWLRAIANIIGFGGTTGFRSVLHAVEAALSGALGGGFFLLIHTGIFWLINRFIFRSRTGFTPLAQRLVLTNIPFTALAAIGVAFSFISTTTLMILLMCGALSSFILTYISLNEEWSSYSESRVLYALMLGYFILFTFIFSLLRVSVIGG